jgi:hypothetical protein
MRVGKVNVVSRSLGGDDLKIRLAIRSTEIVSFQGNGGIETKTGKLIQKSR